MTEEIGLKVADNPEHALLIRTKERVEGDLRSGKLEQEINQVVLAFLETKLKEFE